MRLKTNGIRRLLNIHVVMQLMYAQKKKTTQHNINAYIGNVMYARVQNNACADKTLSVRENMRYTSIFKRIRSRETDVCA